MDWCLAPHRWGFYITHSNAPQSVGLHWTSDQSVAETSTWQHTTLTTDIHGPLGFEPTISASERPQTYALDRAATGTASILTQNYSKKVAHGKTSTEATGSLRSVYRYIALVNGTATIHSEDIYQSCTELSICTHNTHKLLTQLVNHGPNSSQTLPETRLDLYVRIKT